MVGKPMIVAAGAVALLCLLFAVLRATGALERLLPAGNFEAVDFRTLRLASTPNQFLVCPADYCANAPSHLESPVFQILAEDLRNRLKMVLAENPDITIVSEAPSSIDMIARTPLMRWPDWVSIRFVSLSNSRSSLAIYSRSVYGYHDLGTNRKRIRKLLSRLSQRLK